MARRIASYSSSTRARAASAGVAVAVSTRTPVGAVIPSARAGLRDAFDTVDPAIFI